MADQFDDQHTQDNKKHGAEFEPGQIVYVKSNPAIRGAVVSVLPGKPENRFKVFVTGETQTYYASQFQSGDTISIFPLPIGGHNIYFSS